MAPGDYSQAIDIAINAGIDMVMVPNAYRDFIARLKALVAAGRVPQARIDDAVRRILKQKVRFKLWEQPFTDRALTARDRLARAPRGRARRRPQEPGRAEERQADAAAEEARRASTSAACAPTTWASSAAAGRSAGAAGAATSRPAPPSARRSRRSSARRASTTPRTRRAPRRPTWSSSWSARIPTPRAAAIAPSWSSGAQDLALDRRRQAQRQAGGGRAALGAAAHPGRRAGRGERGGRRLAAGHRGRRRRRRAVRRRTSRPASSRARGRANMSQIPINVGDPRATRRCSRTGSACPGERACCGAVRDDGAGRRERSEDGKRDDDTDNGSARDDARMHAPIASRLDLPQGRAQGRDATGRRSVVARDRSRLRAHRSAGGRQDRRSRSTG